MTTGQHFFLFLGSSDREAAVSKLKTSGVPYRKKMLESRPENWQAISQIMRDPALKGVVGKITGYVYGLIARPEYREPAREVFEALSRVPYVLFVHESVLTGKEDEPVEFPGEDDEHSYYDYLARQGYFTPPSEEVRTAVKLLLEEHGVRVMPYKTNAEMSVIAAAFLDDNERNLLFRVYIPTGRLYAAEADKLLSLFREWLGQVGRHPVRQDGYTTPDGHVYEFFGDGSLPQQDISREFEDFSAFLTECLDAPEAATDRLVGAGLDRLSGAQLVTRYGKEARRLQVDLRQAREMRLMSLRHALESELLDATDPPAQKQVQELLEDLIPKPGLVPQQVLTLGDNNRTPPVSIHINQQLIGRVEGTVLQNVHGTVHLNPQAKQLLELIGRFGGSETNDLESAVHELEDTAARPSDRLHARQRLKGLLFRLGNHLEGATIAVLQKYIETKLGLS
ncbi:hypothetical protein FXF53_17985 [Micromonospora sp. WP24]|uniref:hypothetical protein n=1 Tax=Micromonospora sp. WP24 TaxID=2604469 RepID=UPI0011D94B70|nr:hypothetical protein [Micromonospora sp. WP24]TYB98392.1 hypothetical protein FXF53_17985 [Micromonospora sp. WP24]